MAKQKQKIRAGSRVPFRLTVAVTVVLLAAAVAFRYCRPLVLISVWKGQLATVTDDDAPGLLRRVAEMGDRGIPVLAAALGSPRASVARAAEITLRREIARWHRLGVSGSTGRLVILAESLARESPRYSATARQTAAELAMFVLQSPIDRGAIDHGRLMADCETVIRAASADSNRNLKSTPTEHVIVVDGSAAPGFSPQRRGGSLARFGNPLEDDNLLPGGGLPAERISSAFAAPLPSDPPAATPTPKMSFPAIPRPLPRDLATPLAMFRDDRSRAAPISNGAPSSDKIEAGSDAPPRRMKETFIAPDVAELGPQQLFPLLRSNDESTAVGARDELLRRRFSEKQIALAWRLTDPDPHQRRIWAKRLPSIAGIDALPWLLWLAEDSNADVRLEAATLLATSSDPATLKRVRELAADDRDARIRRLAQRIDPRRGR